jgi:DNA-binding NarL/FixJ family response regulator
VSLLTEAYEYPPVPPAPERPYGMSAREVQVVRLLSNGYRNDEIGAQLGITDSTVKFHLARIAEKMDVRPNRVELAVTWVREVERP